MLPHVAGHKLWPVFRLPGLKERLRRILRTFFADLSFALFSGLKHQGRGLSQIVTEYLLILKNKDSFLTTILDFCIPPSN
jgi:hypothetical protein